MLAGLFGAAIGYVYGYVHPYLMSIGVIRILGLPILAFFLAYGLGRLMGNGLTRVLGAKRNPVRVWVIMASALLGMIVAGPFLAEVQSMLAVIGNASNPYQSGTSSAFYVLGPGLRFLGVLFFLRGLSRAF